MFLFSHLCASLSQDVVSSLENAAPSFGALIASYSLSTGNTPGFGHISFSLGMSFTKMSVSSPIHGIEPYEISSPSFHGEIQAGIWNGRYMPMTGIRLFRTAVLARYGMYFHPSAVGRPAENSSSYYYSLGLKIGVLQGGLLFPDASLSAIYTATDEMDIYSMPVTEHDTSFSISARPKVLTIYADVSKRLFFMCPYIGIGMNFTDIGGEFSLYPPSASSNIEPYSRGEVGGFENSYVWRIGSEISLMPFVNLDAEAGMSGGKWTLSIGARAGI